MKSRLFSRFDCMAEGNKQFLSDLRSFLSVPFDQLKLVVKYYPQVVEARTTRLRDAVMRQIERETELPPVKQGPAMNFMGFMLDTALRDETKNDTVEEWVSDLISTKAITEGEGTDLLEKLTYTFEILLVTIEQCRDVAKSESGVMPTLVSCSTAIDLRAVLDNEFPFGSDIDKYSPTVKKMIPVISVSILLDAGHVSEIAFQASVEEIEMLANKLKASITAARVAQSYK